MDLLSDVLHPVTDLPGRRRLRLASSLAVAVPSTRLRTIGDGAFPAVASWTWNSLPPEVTSSTTLSTFKSKLKIYIFSLSFPDLSLLCTVTAVLCTIHFKFVIMIMITNRLGLGLWVRFSLLVQLSDALLSLTNPPRLL